MPANRRVAAFNATWTSEIGEQIQGKNGKNEYLGSTPDPGCNHQDDMKHAYATGNPNLDPGWVVDPMNIILRNT